MLRRRRTDLLVLLGYAAISFGYFGWRLLPHPGRVVAGFGSDTDIFDLVVRVVAARARELRRTRS